MAALELGTALADEVLCVRIVSIALLPNAFRVITRDELAKLLEECR